MSLKDMIFDHPEVFGAEEHRTHPFEVFPHGPVLVEMVIHPEYPSWESIADDPNVDPEMWESLVQLSLNLEEIPEDKGRIACNLRLENFVRDAGVEDRVDFDLTSNDQGRIYGDVISEMRSWDLPDEVFPDKAPRIRQMVDLALRVRAMIPEYEDTPLFRERGESPR